MILGRTHAPVRRSAAFASLFALLLAAVSTAAPAPVRVKLNFDPDWRFLRADPGPLAAMEGFDDSAWTLVSAPHTYNDVDSFDHYSVPGHRGEQGTWGGRTWYRKHFLLPAAYRGKRIYIEFEAVRQVAEVYLNGTRLGACKTGFTPFGFDLTPYVRFGDEPNVLAVMCDNRFMKDPMDIDNLGQMSKRVNAQIPEKVDDLQADQIPWNNPHWHPAHGGIYRNVYLYVLDPLHISLPLFDFLQTEGPYVYATDIGPGSARLHVEIPVENGRPETESVEAEVAVLDASGRVVARGAGAARAMAPGAATKFEVNTEILRPELWEPAHPYLYRIVCRLRTGGHVVDDQTVPYGIRTVRWDVRKGFFINGHHLKLRGWGQKPNDEWPGLGSALPDWMHAYTLELMKEAGGNWVRWGHCAGAPAAIRAGDELGIMAEQPGVDGESDTVRAAWTLRTWAFRDVLVYFRNDPSIMIWEGGNQKVTLAHVRQLRALVNRFDPHGGRAYAHRRADQTDAKYLTVGIGTEGGREIKNLPVVEGEYDREESPRRVWDDYSPPNFGYPEAADKHLNAYQLTAEQYAVDEISQTVDKIGASDSAGGSNWIFSDSTSGGRLHAEVTRASGEVDGARLPKPAYYVLATMFRSDPQVHIIGHWTYPPGTRKNVYVASNADDVELVLNGRSLGHGVRSETYLFTFKQVAWEPGTLRAIAYRGGRAVAEDTLVTAGPPVALRLSVLTGPGGLHADGSDVAVVDVEAVDAKGERCPTVQQRVDFTWSGPALWRGGYDSGKTDTVDKPYLDLEAGVNRVVLRAGRRAGAITVRATSGDLRPAGITFDSVPFPASGGISTELPADPLPWLRKLSSRVSEFNPLVQQGAQGMGDVLMDVQPPPEALPAGSQPGRFVESFSYTGPMSIAHVEMHAGDGKTIYGDQDYRFAGLPRILLGADWVQGADGDAFYSAADLMEIGVPAGATVYVAHDDRLPVPGWLSDQFVPTTLKLAVDGQPMSLFRRRAQGPEGLTLGSNTDDPRARTGHMYIVFVKGGGRRKSAAGQ